jgi:hypothetical protein
MTKIFEESVIKLPNEANKLIKKAFSKKTKIIKEIKDTKKSKKLNKLLNEI